MTKIKYSTESKLDMQSIYDYIADTWKIPKTAQEITVGIDAAIKDLKTFPDRYKIFEYEPWTSIGLRYFFVKNYTVFYVYEKDKDTVTVVRIIYKSRNYHEQLKSSEHYFVSDNTLEDKYNDSLKK